MSFSTITSLRRCPCFRCFTSRRLPVPALLALASCRLRTTNHWIVASFVCASLAVVGRVLAQSQTSTPNRLSELAAQQKEDEIQIPLKNGTTLKATLTIPKLSKLAPAVLMIPGYIAGHRPRDEEAFRQPGQDSGTLLARYLLSQGFAVMRVPIGGGPNGNEPSLSITDLADRELDCIAYLKTHAEIDPKQVGIMGQSIGGFIGMAAAARANDLAFLVTLATPVESIDQTFLDALDRVLMSGNAPEKERAEIRAMMVAVFTDAAGGATADQLRPRLDEFFRAEYKWLPDTLRKTAGKDANEFIERVLNDHLRDTTSPMFRSLIGQDSAHTLAHVRCPVLVLFAEKDFKVEPQRSSRIAQEALSKSGVEKWDVKVMPGADHFFQTSAGRPSSELQDTLTTWFSRNLEINHSRE